ncbi:MAG: YhbY family RNA-binding protein [Clostridia bacterium]|nr:YhbY family RNA-binding protein [Clostridia bacterium]
MMTSKERAALRSQANGLESVFWLGKDGITDNFISQITDIFRTRELIKISVQETAPESAKELAAKIAELAQCEVVQVLGRKITLYRYNEELHKPKQKAKPVRAKKVEPSKNSGKPRRSGRAIGYGNAKSRWKNKGKDGN